MKTFKVQKIFDFDQSQEKGGELARNFAAVNFLLEFEVRCS